MVRKLISSGIERIVIDFASSKKFANIKEKVDRDYQGEDRMLLIVLCGDNRHKFNTLDKMRRYILTQGRKGNVEHYRNIKVIIDSKFMEFLGIKDGNPLYAKYKEFQEIRDELYITKHENTMIKLIRLWEESQK